MLTITKTSQEKLHKWEKANQVTFEETKKSFYVLLHRWSQGEDFKLLGIQFDCKLAMNTAVHKLAEEAH